MTRDAEVDDLDARLAGDGVVQDEHVGRFEVAVDVAGVVKRGDRVRDLLGDRDDRTDRQVDAVDHRLERLAVEQLHDQVEINEEKSRIVDLGRGESFGFLGVRLPSGAQFKGRVACSISTPKLKKRTALLRKLKDMFGRNQSQPVGRVVKLINPVLRGWVNYFAVGHSSECFSFVKDWVEKKIKRHMQRARNRQGFGWTRWSREWTY